MQLGVLVELLTVGVGGEKGREKNGKDSGFSEDRMAVQTAGADTCAARANSPAEGLAAVSSSALEYLVSGRGSFFGKCCSPGPCPSFSTAHCLLFKGSAVCLDVGNTVRPGRTQGTSSLAWPSVRSHATRFGMS